MFHYFKSLNVARVSFTLPTKMFIHMRLLKFSTFNHHAINVVDHFCQRSNNLCPLTPWYAWLEHNIPLISHKSHLPMDYINKQSTGTSITAHFQLGCIPSYFYWRPFSPIDRIKIVMIFSIYCQISPSTPITLPMI